MSNAIDSAPIGRPAYSQTLPREPASAGRARRLVAAALGTWGLSRLGDTSALVVTELVGNAAKHARSQTIRVTITRVGPLRVQVAVVDRSQSKPAARKAGPEDEGGRGLPLIESVSARWGTDPLPWGKRVWAEIGVEDPRGTAATAPAEPTSPTPAAGALA